MGARRRKKPVQAQSKSKRTLLPVMRPAQNMRDIIKECALVEDHLGHAERRCPDCIRKHLLKIEGLAEECASLCKPAEGSVSQDARNVAKAARVLNNTWASAPKSDAVNRAVAAKVRTVRKYLMPAYATLPLTKLPHDEAAEVAKLVRAAKAKAKPATAKPATAKPATAKRATAKPATAPTRRSGARAPPSGAPRAAPRSGTARPRARRASRKT
mgnify:CR=1 FL=1